MPYFEIREDQISIFYDLYTPGSTLDPSLPVLLLLAPGSLDSRAMAAQYEDPQLRRSFTILTLDERCTGKSSSATGNSMAADAWVQAADLARLILHLGLPPVHVFSAQAGATRQAVRLAALWPDLVKTLIVGGLILDIMITPTRHNEFFDMWDAVGSRNQHAEQGLQRWVGYFFGDPDDNLAPPKVRQQVYDALVENFSGDHSENVANIARIMFYRTPVPRERILSLHKPTLLFWGTENTSVPITVAMGMSHRYKTADGKAAKLEVIDGAPNLLSMSHPHIINPKIAEFIRAHHDKNQRPSSKALEKDVPYWEDALKRFAQMVDDPELGIAHRNPKSNLSFSALTHDRVKELEKLRRKWSKKS